MQRKIRKIVLTEEKQSLFWSKVHKSCDCWLWVGDIDVNGYGYFPIKSKNLRVHRVAYTLTHGEIPEDKVIDHLCRVRHCVNPAHMDVVTNKENVLRGVGVTAQNAKKTHCKYGHEFTPENIDGYYKKRGLRKCLACNRIECQRQRDMVKAAAIENPEV